LTRDGKPYGPYKYKELVKSLFILSKNLNTSYIDLRDNLTPSEMTSLLLLLKEEDEKNREYIDKIKADKEKKKNSQPIRYNY